MDQRRAVRARAGHWNQWPVENEQGSIDQSATKSLNFRTSVRVLSGPVVAFALGATCAVASPDPVVLPSGISARLHEVIGPEEGHLRLRYVADGFDPLGVDPEVLLADMTFLCENSVLPEVEALGTSPRITVSIADRPAEFGVLDTDVRQSFEAFTIDGDTCIWEAF
ncbi:MAG: DUF6497 family protein [Roseovarius sp.]